MNCALLFSGQLRGFNHCIEKIQQTICSKFDEVDYFFYLPSEDSKNIQKVIDTKPKILTLAQDTYDPIEEIIACKNEISYSQHKIAKNGYSLKGRMQHYLLQWYGVYSCYKYFEDYCTMSGKVYNFAARIRCDHFPITSFNIEQLDNHAVNIPIANGSSNDDFGGIHDRFAIGDMSNMKIYCYKYESIKKDNLGFGNSESKLLRHLQNNNCKINRFRYFYERLNNDGTVQAWR